MCESTCFFCEGEAGWSARGRLGYAAAVHRAREVEGEMRHPLIASSSEMPVLVSKREEGKTDLR